MATATKLPALQSVPRTASRKPVEPIADELLDGKERSPKAKAYESKVKGILNLVMKSAVQSETFVSDGAAILAHGPDFCKAAGDLADHDPRAAKIIDFINGGSDNPYAAMIVAAIPLVAQVVRNHEMEAAAPVGIRIPFTKLRFNLKLRLRLKNPFLRAATMDGDELSRQVFSTPGVLDSLKDQGVNVAWNMKHGTANNTR
jgi:hypothetical protein